MDGRGSWQWAAWVLSAGLLLPAGIHAGWPGKCDTSQAPDCPPHEYSCCHYWTPTLYRLRAYCHGAQLDSGIPCGIAPHCEVIQFPCQAEPDGMLYTDSSRLRYQLGPQSP